VKPRKSFSFTAVASNAGPDTSDVSLVLQLSGPATGLAVSGAGCTLSGTTVTCAYAARPKGWSASVVLYGTAGTKGTLTASAAVDGSDTDTNAANDRSAASIQIN
jgi:hypothetical protein